MIILGINAYHGDSSACLVIDGKLICAIEEERIRRIKHLAGLPVEAVKWCLEYAGVKITEVDYIAISRNPFAHLHKKMLRVIKNLPSVGFIKGRLQNIAKISDIKSALASELNIDLKKLKAKLVMVEHHNAHLASAFFVSPFDEAVCVSVDGFGDFKSTMRGIGRGNKINILDRVHFPHSLGIFYTAFTQFLGFWKYGDEYKVMGLSAYGDPDRFKEKVREIVRLRNDGLFELDTSYFLHDTEGVEMTWLNEEPKIGRLFSNKFVKVFGKPRERDDEIAIHYQDIASALQSMYEDAFFHILTDLYKRYKIENLVLAGGCIQNSVANGKIYDRTPFKNVYIPPAAHDAGTAIGAAFWVWNVLLGRRRDFVMEHAYWGPEFSEGEISMTLKTKITELEKQGCKVMKIENEEELFSLTAKAIADGKIVGWFQGRTEWGPRALGNRSMLADPRRKEMKDILNARIKRREWFRPFAPSILEEFVSDWFEFSYPVPFMEKVYKIKTDKRDLIPAVTHVDGTGRLQTVSKNINPKYYRLIEAFYKLTGIPLVLNTSFNENEPIVNTPEDALNCFLRTKMDVLVMGNFYIYRAFDRTR
jgi:carbamoyltransferase